MGGLSTRHQSFIQCMMARGALTADETKKLYNSCVQGDNGPQASEVQDLEDLKNEIYIINKEIAIADFTIRPAYSPWEDCTYWGLCNLTYDEISEVASILRPAEVELFFAIVTELLHNNGTISLPDAQNLAIKSMTVSEHAHAIQQMHQLQWLRIVRKAGEQTKVIIGPRSLIELPKVRQWARKFSGERHELGEPGAESGAKEHEMEDKRGMEVEEEDEEEESDEIRPRGRRSARRVSLEEDEEDEESSEDEVRPVSRSRNSQRLYR